MKCAYAGRPPMTLSCRQVKVGTPMGGVGRYVCPGGYPYTTPAHLSTTKPLGTRAQRPRLLAAQGSPPACCGHGDHCEEPG